MKIYIKNMVSIRCKMVVKSELEKLSLGYKCVEPGEVEQAVQVYGLKFKLCITTFLVNLYLQ